MTTISYRPDLRFATPAPTNPGTVAKRRTSACFARCTLTGSRSAIGRWVLLCGQARAKPRQDALDGNGKRDGVTAGKQQADDPTLAVHDRRPGVTGAAERAVDPLN